MFHRSRTAESVVRRDAVSTVSSRLLPLLLETIEDRDHVNVLDASGGSQGTVDLFSGRRARIHFLDLCSCPLVVHPPEKIDIAQATAEFLRYLNLPDDLVFDVCLFWDSLHYLDTAVLDGLSRALMPHFDERTIGYGFGSLHAGALAGQTSHGRESDRFRYGLIRGSDLLLRREDSSQPRHAYTQQQLNEHFPALTIQRATLLREGLLELLLGRT